MICFISIWGFTKTTLKASQESFASGFHEEISARSGPACKQPGMPGALRL
jgi:hypothetical protein